MFSDPKHNIDQINLDPGMVVVDIGSGSGFYSLEAAKIVGDSGKVYAVDVQRDLLARLKAQASASHIHNIEIICGDAEKLGGTRIKDGSAHYALACNILFQLEDKKGFFEEVKRILKPQGRLLVVDWSDSFGGIGPAPEHVIKEIKTKEIAEQSGLKYERSIRAGSHHYGLVFRKI